MRPAASTWSMEVSGDELAGVVGVFGGLTRAELGDALVELAFKAGEQVDAKDFEDDIEAACRSYCLLPVPADYHELSIDEPVLVPGPVAFGSLPPGATDLPHILDIEERSVSTEATAEAAESLFRRDAAQAVASQGSDRRQELIDASYELEAWGPIDLADVRAQLDSAFE